MLLRNLTVPSVSLPPVESNLAKWFTEKLYKPYCSTTVSTPAMQTQASGEMSELSHPLTFSAGENRKTDHHRCSVCDITAPMCLYDIKSDSSLSNKCPCFNIHLLSWQLWDIISQIEISQPYLKTWWRPSYWRHDWLSGLLPGEADCSLNNMISLNAAPIPRPAKPA